MQLTVFKTIPNFLLQLMEKSKQVNRTIKQISYYYTIKENGEKLLCRSKVRGEGFNDGNSNNDINNNGKYKEEYCFYHDSNWYDNNNNYNIDNNNSTLYVITVISIGYQVGRMYTTINSITATIRISTH